MSTQNRTTPTPESGRGQMLTTPGSGWNGRLTREALLAVLVWTIVMASEVEE